MLKNDKTYSRGRLSNSAKGPAEKFLGKVNDKVYPWKLEALQRNRSLSKNGKQTIMPK